MHIRMLACLSALILAASPPAADAQQEEVPCVTYDACALRVEPGDWGRKLVRGTRTEEVARLGIFSPDLRMIQGADSAGIYARRFERDYGRGALLGVASGILIYFPLAHTGAFGDSRSDVRGSDFVLIGVAALVGIVGGHYTQSAERALSRALWWHNRELTR